MLHEFCTRSLEKRKFQLIYISRILVVTQFLIEHVKLSVDSRSSSPDSVT